MRQLSEQRLFVIVKAVELMQYTMEITSNRKRFPSKHIILVKRIQDKCLDIYESLLEANRLDVVTCKEERLRLQTKAITACDTLSCYSELSMNLKLIGSGTMEHWQKKINTVKYMTIKWRKRDQER